MINTRPMEFETYKVVISVAVLAFLGLFVRLYNAIVVKPRKLRSLLRRQGINGPKRSLLLGNIREVKKARIATVKSPAGENPVYHNGAAAVFPFLENWRKKYGKLDAYNYQSLVILFLFLVINECTETVLNFAITFAGDVFTFDLGNIQILYVSQPDIVREITTCTSLDLGKPSYQQKELGPLLGQGILTSNGTLWAHQRKLLAPELCMEKVKV